MRYHSEREPESERKVEEMHFYLETKGANVFFTVPLSHLPRPFPKDFIEVVFPVNADGKTVEKAKKILEGAGGQECGIFPGYIKYDHLPPDWAVPVQVIRAFIPEDLASRIGLERKLSKSGVACTSRERMIFKTIHLKTYHPSKK